ncbi:Ubiquinone/menaquinone biosynthesis C-methylase UbiE [Rhizobium miluonense]|uniref:Ubiquinone/menaquinone biosynthesis C-methylase UbiE n=2 Tax=Rhizobium miluonense TaxID=411945 RepID=A0A1C3WP80_9HYPH|nr:Ubiquinone/menaquinone biosynthesis C-methylase UbiE [Rhizobium miluonense]
MSIAVGGNYDTIGNIASQVVVYAGAKDGDAIFDFGCGSGRVASHLSKRVDIKRFLGTDVVQSLLDYAATKTPEHFAFVKHQQLSVPAEDGSFDLAYAFSVFTHLLQAEIYLYLQDIARVLKPGGTFVFSFLELAEEGHWHVFQSTVATLAAKQPSHLNMFTERNQLAIWAAHAGFDVVEFIDGGDPRWNGEALGQAVAIFRKR